jgi:phosphoglycolate phosphatase
VLWDVDGTLVFNGGVSKEAYARGFELLTGRQIVHPVVTGGQTDLAIMRSLFTRHGLDLTNDVVARIPQVMTTALDSLVPRLRERGRAMPGAREAISALAQRPGLIQSVLTGNIAPNAYTKLATFGLHAASTSRSARTDPTMTYALNWCLSRAGGHPKSTLRTCPNPPSC